VLNGTLRKGGLFQRVDRRDRRAHGKYRWHFQQVHQDIWDYDSANPIILFDAPYDGAMRKGLAQAAKTGWVYLVDRATGEPLLGIEALSPRGRCSASSRTNGPATCGSSSTWRSAR
jgi:glucose dehydrogenase